MKCYICDAGIENPKYNSAHKNYEPCTTCLEIINEVFEDYVEEEDEREEEENTPIINDLDDC
jgi:cytidine deaminase